LKILKERTHGFSLADKCELFGEIISHPESDILDLSLDLIAMLQPVPNDNYASLQALLHCTVFHPLPSVRTKGKKLISVLYAASRDDISPVSADYYDLRVTLRSNSSEPLLIDFKPEALAEIPYLKSDKEKADFMQPLVNADAARAIRLRYVPPDFLNLEPLK
jgi:hypothetical protein